MTEFGKQLLLLGAVLAAVGLFLLLAGRRAGPPPEPASAGQPAAKTGLALGRLPGDIRIRRKNFSFYFPLTTCIVISALLTLLLRLFGKK